MLSERIIGQNCQMCWSPLPGDSDLCHFCKNYRFEKFPDLPRLVESLSDRLEQGRRVLRDNLVIDQGHVGWYHHLGERGRTGISSSAYGLHALSLVEPHSSLLSEIADRILNDRSRYTAGSEDSLQIAWPMTHEPTTPLVEPTCYVLQQLNLAGVLKQTSKEARASIRWLLTQQQDHAWGPQQASDPYVYVTSLVCQTLAVFSPEAAELPIALAWLEKAQNDDGGWGERPNDQHSRVWTTAHATLAFILGRRSRVKGNDVIGVKWLRENVNNWLEPYTIDYEFSLLHNSNRRGRASYRFDALPIVILALLRSGLRPIAPDLLQGINRLLDQQVEGVWLYPYSNQKTIFNLSHAMQALVEFRGSLSSPGMLADFYRRMTLIEEQGPEHSGETATARTSLRRKMRRVAGFSIVALSAGPVLWLLIGRDAFIRMATRIDGLLNHPIILIASLSGVLFGLGIANRVSSKKFFVACVVLVAFGVLLGLRGTFGDAVASVLPPLIAALVKVLLGEVKKRPSSQNSTQMRNEI